MKKLFLVMVLISTMVLSGCWIGDKVGQAFGSDTPPDKKSPAEKAADWLMILGLGAGGTAAAAALRLMSRAVRIKNAGFDVIKDAIDSGKLAEAKTEVAIKKVFSEAQKMHHDSKLIGKAYKDWKYKKKSG